MDDPDITSFSRHLSQYDRKSMGAFKGAEQISGYHTRLLKGRGKDSVFHGRTSVIERAYIDGFSVQR